MTALHFSAIAIRMVMVAALALFPQSADNTPETKDGLIKLFNTLKNNPNLKGGVKDDVERVGVDFELDPGTEQEFRILGMDQALLDAIRKNVKIAAINVQCQPVECQVSI